MLPVDERTLDSGVNGRGSRKIVAMKPHSSLAVCLALALVLISCGDDSTRSGSDSAATATSEATVQEVQPVTTAPVEIVAAACATDAILPVVAALFPENDMWNIVDVDVVDCQNGYARVFAIADQSTCDLDTPQCFEDRTSLPRRSRRDVGVPDLRDGNFVRQPE